MPEEEYLQYFGKSREEMVSETKEELRDAVKRKDKKKIKELSQKLKQVFVGDDVMWANEVASNIFVAVCMIFILAIVAIVIVLNQFDVFHLDNGHLIPLSCVCAAEMVIGIILTFVYGGEKVWLKYINMFFVCVSIAMLNGIFGYRVEISLTLPVILSTKYLQEKFTRTISWLSGFFMLTSTLTSVRMAAALDLNTVEFPAGTTIVINESFSKAVEGLTVDTHRYMINLLQQSFLPNILQYILICFICITIAKWGHKTVHEQASVATEFARVDTELNMARDIQANVLPRIFPAFPERQEFDIYASMDPAKEVGGDFYDFFMVDENHLAVVMADVSGKGVPAALFMMIGKAFIKNKTMTGVGPAEVFNFVNNELCENNDLELFITAWLGILDLRNGHMVAANAGHEYPMIRRAEGDFQLFKEKHGFVLAGVEDFCYQEYELDLHPGDSLFVYTDGATEANNAEHELFGTDRLLQAVTNSEKDNPGAALVNIRKEIDAFVGDAPQFDDITMLELIYYGK